MCVMNSIRQLIRQPMKTLAGVILVTIAVAILVTCLGQAMVSLNIGESVDELFTTIALPTGRYQIDESGCYFSQSPEEVTQVIKQLTDEQTELIEEVSPLGLASAFIPELTIDNYSQHPNRYDGDGNYMSLRAQPEGTPYNCAMLEIMLEEIREPEEQADGSIRMILRGQILSAVGLQDGFNDPVGMTAHITLSLPNEKALKELALESGQRYLVYSFDYYDYDWRNRSIACNAYENGEITMKEMEPEKLFYQSEKSIEREKEQNPDWYNVAYYGDQYGGMPFSQKSIDYFRAVTLEVEDASVMPEYAGQAKREVYSIPTITRLTGSIEDFLASEEGAAWREMLEMIEINNHAFPVMGVTNLSAVPDFNRGTAEISLGRDFSAAELKNGFNVCIVSKEVAELSGVTVGDTIILNYYQNDANLPYQDSLTEGNGVLNPAAAMYFEGTTPFVGEAEKYTIVGIYEQGNSWGHLADNLYACTSNVVFVPQKSVKSEMEFSEVLQFGTIQLKNGSIEEFTEAMFEAGYPYLYEFYDQGYTLVMENLQNYSAIARQAMTIGIVVWAMVVLLFLVIFPARQGSAIARMGSLGTTRAQKMGHVLVSALGILAPGTVIGAGTGILLWETVVGGLTGAVAVDLDLSLNVPMIGLIALAQLAAAMAAVAVMALVMTRERSLMKKR